MRIRQVSLNQNDDRRQESEKTVKLEIGNFHVKDVVFGETTSFENGILTVNKKEAIAYLDPEGKLTNIELYVVHPGDSARLVPAKAVVEPRFRPDGRTIFPGYLGEVSSCGDGQIYAMKGMSVICCGKYSSMTDGLVDMSGPAAEHCAFSKLVNLVVYAERKEERELELTIRNETEQKKAAALLAEYVAKTLEHQEPETWEIYDFDAKKAEAEAKGLPRVAFNMILCSQLGNGCNDQIYGADCHNMLSILTHPNCILDGMLVTHFGLMGQGSSTYGFQNQPIIKRLYEEHGKTINFVGVILSPGDVSNDMKLRMKTTSGTIASLMELDGVVVAEWGGGSNIDVDFFYQLAEMKDRGIKTVGIMSEHGGKMMQDPKGDAIVSGGDTNTVYELPAMDLVIGDIQSVGRDYFYGAWYQHDVYGPSLREDGSLIISTYMIGTGGNIDGFIHKTVKEY